MKVSIVSGLMKKPGSFEQVWEGLSIHRQEAGEEEREEASLPRCGYG